MPVTRTRKNEGDELTVSDELYSGLDENDGEGEVLEYELAFGLPEKAVRLVMETASLARITFDNGEDKQFDIKPFHMDAISISSDGSHFVLQGKSGPIELSLDTVYFESVPL